MQIFDLYLLIFTTFECQNSLYKQFNLFRAIFKIKLKKMIKFRIGLFCLYIELFQVNQLSKLFKKNSIHTF